MSVVYARAGRKRREIIRELQQERKSAVVPCQMNGSVLGQKGLCGFIFRSNWAAISLGNISREVRHL